MLSVSVRHPLDGFDLAVALEAAGPVLTLFGPSGAGKTTMLNVIAGLVTPAAGRVVVDDVVLFDSASGIAVRPEDRRIGYVFQDARLFPHLSVRDNLRFGQTRALRRGDVPLALDAVVELLALAPLLARRPRTLSGGERQRVALGRALLSAPRMLLLDEPFAALDAARRQELLPDVARLRRAFGIPMVFVTHVLEEALRVADQLALIDRGTLVRCGAPAEAVADLSLSTYFGQPAALLEGSVVEHCDEHFSRINCDGLQVVVPRTREAGTVRVTVFAEDVALALEEPPALSANNVLAGRVTAIQPAPGGRLDVRIEVGGHALVARITQLSGQRLGVGPGLPVYAIVKSVKVTH